MSLEAIHAAIPHRPPFLLVDRIVAREPERIVCRKTLGGEEFWFRGHYPDFPVMPGVLLCEAAMQAGAILLAGHVEPDDRSVPVATRLADVRFKRMVRPGETIEMEVVLQERLAGAYFLAAKVTVGGRLAARLSFACTMAPRGENPDGA